MGKQLDEEFSLQELVETTLAEYPHTRGNDDLLYAMVIEDYFRLGNYKLSLATTNALLFFSYRSQWGLPSFASVTRQRRLIQARLPELKPNKVVQGYRQEQEQMYRELAKGGSDERLDKATSKDT